MTDVRKMSDEELDKEVRREIYMLEPEAIAALDEITSRLKVMRKLCEEVGLHSETCGCVQCEALVAYRQMEDERERP